MLDPTGGEAATLAESPPVRTSRSPGRGLDLEAMLRLCICRTNLAERNRHIPIGLAALWVTLGQPARADQAALQQRYLRYLRQKSMGPTHDSFALRARVSAP